MAVAETSRSCGKSNASGATRSTRTQSARCSRTEIQASNRPLSLVYIAQAAINSIANIALQAARNVNLLAAPNTATIANHNYQSATGQSGIAAGNGGFDIKVAGNTDLKGGAITKTPSPPPASPAATWTTAKTPTAPAPA
jgi:hypothetical protein